MGYVPFQNQFSRVGRLITMLAIGGLAACGSEGVPISPGARSQAAITDEQGGAKGPLPGSLLPGTATTFAAVENPTVSTHGIDPNIALASPSVLSFDVLRGRDGKGDDDGETGPTGPKGATGATGATGEKGATGAAGATGPTGAAGTNGTNGVTGPTGAAGTNGANGAIGPTGAAGTNGTNGAIGPTGAAGTNGTNGATGPTGAAGTNGTNGPTGEVGTTGPMGPQGPTGTSGPGGPPGPTGPAGATGSPGTPVPPAFDPVSVCAFAPGSSGVYLLGQSSLLQRFDRATWKLQDLSTIPIPAGLLAMLIPASSEGSPALVAGSFFGSPAKFRLSLFRLNDTVGGSYNLSEGCLPGFDDLGSVVLAVAPAGIDASGAEGGYSGRGDDLFVMRALGGIVRLELMSVSGNGSSMCSSQVVDIPVSPGSTFVHDPSTHRILLTDPGSQRLRVYGYDVTGGPITLRATTLPVPGFSAGTCTTYDSATGVLWNRGTPLQFDLSKL